MKPIPSLISLCLVILFSQGCSEKPSTPTDFQLTLGAAVSSVGMDGGIILMGTNGSDKFSAGLSPKKAEDFSLELPGGEWRFQAVGWMNDSNGMMTGESRCAYTTASIDGADTVVKLSLSQEKCFDGVIATPMAKDLGQSAGPHFKKLKFTSCLTLDSVSAGELCKDEVNYKLPGVSTSLRLSFPGASNFGASVPTLNSACFNHPGFLNHKISDGGIPTSLRLPFDGSEPIPWVLTGYEEKDCQDKSADYAMPDGINGVQGLGRIFEGSGNVAFLNFADNYVGGANSIFSLVAPGSIIPDIACAPDCYPNTSFKPYDPAAGRRDLIKFKIYDVLGNKDHLDPYSVQGTAPAFIMSTTHGLTFTAPIELGSIGNSINILFIDTTTGSSTPIVSCPQHTIQIDYESGLGTTTSEVVNEVNSQCGHLVHASTTLPNEVITNISDLTLGGGDDSIDMSRKYMGDLAQVRKTLIGPVGALLYQNGITGPAKLCDVSSYGNYGFNLGGENVTLELGAPTAAKHPEFATNPTHSFERKITIAFNGFPEEAFYFNCSSSPNNSVGAYVRHEEQDDGRIHSQQIFWDTTTDGQEWFEVGNREESLAGSLYRQDYFLFKASSVDAFDVFVLSADDSRNEYEYAVAKAQSGEFFVQGGSEVPGSIDARFSRQTLDNVFNMATDNLNGTDPGMTQEPTDINANMTRPSMFLGYDMDSFIQHDLWSLYQ